MPKSTTTDNDVLNANLRAVDPGTMGNKLNSASAAGDPWTASLPGTYVDGSAGKIVGSQLLKTSTFIGLK